MAFALPLPCPNNRMAPAGDKASVSSRQYSGVVVFVGALRVPGQVVDLMEAAAGIGGNDAVRPLPR